MSAELKCGKYTVTGTYTDGTLTTIYISISESINSTMSSSTVVKPRMPKHDELGIAVRDAIQSLAVGTVRIRSYGVVYEFDASNSMLVKQKCIDALKAFCAERKC